jgi:hypothetical protein
MDKTQKTERYNIFNLIHKGLRHILYDTALELQRADFGRPDESHRLLGQVELVLEYFEGHAEVEDIYILPAIHRFDANLAADFESQHAEDHRLGELLLALTQEVGLQVNAAERIPAAARLTYAFNEFVGFNLYHMNKEESAINAVLWQHFVDAELQAITQQIIQHIAPLKLTALNRWMMRSINLAEVTEWLAGVRKNAPTEVYNAFLVLAAEELDAETFFQLKQRLNSPDGIPTPQFNLTR